MTVNKRHHAKPQSFQKLPSGTPITLVLFYVFVTPEILIRDS